MPIHRETSSAVVRLANTCMETRLYLLYNATTESMLLTKIKTAKALHMLKQVAYN